MEPLISSSPPSHLALLLKSSLAFNSSLDLDEVLNKVIDEVIVAIRAERGFVMLVNKAGNMDFRTARGIDQQTIFDPSFQISRSVVERVQNEGYPILTSDALSDERFYSQQSIVDLGLRSILCVPLKDKKDAVIGIIYVDNRLRSGIFNKNDLDLLNAIASNAVIAIENATLYKELESAYNQTLEGWAKAVQLRDQDTEEHTLRVAKLTVMLAKEIGVDGEALTQIMRGALLHDIGKMGIPDSILLKAGRFSLEEFNIMKTHPILAYNMLQSIEFLRPAIDIPYCHHEKWDGSGYPRGLRGEEIPLAARIFAVIDVWDALRSTRIYRSEKWSKEMVIRYLQEQSGRHFDPGVVRIFLNLIQIQPQIEQMYTSDDTNSQLSLFDISLLL